MYSKQCDIVYYSVVSSLFDYRSIKISFLHTKSYVSAPFYAISSCYQHQNTNEYVRFLGLISLRRKLNGGLPWGERLGVCVCCHSKMYLKQCDIVYYSAVSSLFDYRSIKISFLHTKSYVSAPFYAISSCYQHQNTNEYVRFLGLISLRRKLNGVLSWDERETCVCCHSKMLLKTMWHTL